MHFWKGSTIQAAWHVLDCSKLHSRVWLSSFHILDLKRKGGYSTKDKEAVTVWVWDFFFFARELAGSFVCLILCHSHGLKKIVYKLNYIWKTWLTKDSLLSGCSALSAKPCYHSAASAASPSTEAMTLPSLKLENPVTLLLNEFKCPDSEYQYVTAHVVLFRLWLSCLFEMEYSRFMRKVKRTEN